MDSNNTTDAGQIRRKTTSLDKIDVLAQPKDATLDIVFVHGVTGRSLQTWGGTKVSNTWLRYLVKLMPDACIMTCGFNVLRLLDNDPELIAQTAKRLVEKLATHNRTRRITTPIIFVAHSLGGMLVRKALLEAPSEYSNMVKALIFLGTPNFTHDKGWEEFGDKITRAFSRKRELSFPKLQYLKRINDDFIAWLGKIVPAEDASILGYGSSLMSADHLSLARLESIFDPQYQQFASQLQSMAKFSRSEIARTMSIGIGPTFAQDIERNAFALDGRTEIVEKIATFESDLARELGRALELEDVGDYAKAADSYQNAIDCCDKPDNKSDLSIRIFCMDKRALMLMDCCEFKDAEELATKTWQIRRDTGPRGDSATLSSAGNLARILRYRSKWLEALYLLRDMLEDMESSPFNSIEGTAAASILAKLFKDLGYYDLSELVSRDVIRACQRLLGPDHPFTCNRECDLAVVWSKRQEFKSAERMTRKALDGLGKALGSKHPHTLRAAKRLGSYLRFQGRLNEAQGILQVTFERQVEIFGYEHPDPLSTQCSLASLYALRGQFAEAEVLLTAALKIRRHLFTSNPDTKWTEKALDMIHYVKRQTAPFSEPTRARLETLFQRPTQTSRQKRAETHNMFFSPSYDPIAAYKNDGMEIKALSSQDSDSNPVILGKALRFAAACNNSNVVQALLPRANLHSRGGFYGDVLQAAIWSGDVGFIRLLLDNDGLDLDSGGGIFGSPLRAAVILGKMDVVELLLSSDINSIKQHDIIGTPLEAALVGRHSDAVRALLDDLAVHNPAKITGQNTVLHEAAQEGNLEVMKLLLEAGAEINTPRYQLETKSRGSKETHHANVLRWLLKTENGNDAFFHNLSDTFNFALLECRPDSSKGSFGYSVGQNAEPHNAEILAAASSGQLTVVNSLYQLAQGREEEDGSDSSNVVDEAPINDHGAPGHNRNESFDSEPHSATLLSSAGSFKTAQQDGPVVSRKTSPTEPYDVEGKDGYEIAQEGDTSTPTTSTTSPRWSYQAGLNKASVASVNDTQDLERTPSRSSFRASLQRLKRKHFAKKQ